MDSPLTRAAVAAGRVRWADDEENAEGMGSGAPAARAFRVGAAAPGSAGAGSTKVPASRAQVRVPSASAPGVPMPASPLAAVVGEIIERGGAGASSMAEPWPAADTTSSAATSGRVALPGVARKLEASVETGFPVVFHRSELRTADEGRTSTTGDAGGGPSTSSGSGTGSGTSIFKQRLQAAQAKRRGGAVSGGGIGRGDSGLSAGGAGAGATAATAAAAAAQSSLLAGFLDVAHAPDAARPLAAQVGLREGVDLAALGSSNARVIASLQAGGAGQVQEAVAEVSSLLTDSTIQRWIAMRARQAAAAANTASAPSATAAVAPPPPPSSSSSSSSSAAAAAALRTTGGHSRMPLDLSGIQTEEQLIAAARAYLPEAEKEKLRWTGMLDSDSDSDSDSDGAGAGDGGAGAGAGAGGRARRHAEDAAEGSGDGSPRDAGAIILPSASLPAGESTALGARAAYAAGTAQLFALWAQAAADVAADAEACEEEEDEDQDEDEDEGGGGQSAMDRAEAAAAVEEEEEVHPLTTDTAAVRMDTLQRMLGLPQDDAVALSTGRRSRGRGDKGGSRGNNASSSGVMLRVHPSITRLRFDLEGYTVKADSSVDGDAALASGALYHHAATTSTTGSTASTAATASAAGYSLLDILGLTRSAVTGQRGLAYRMLAGLLRRRRAAFVSPTTPPAEGGASASAASAASAAWRYSTQEWPAEAAALRTLLLPPMLPILLRNGIDDNNASVLLPALQALASFMCDTEGGTDREDREDRDGEAGQEAGQEATGQLLPPLIRPQPPIADEGDAERLEQRAGWAGVAETDGDADEDAEGEAEGEGDTHGTAPPSAGAALKQGRQALQDPVYVLCKHTSLLERLCSILQGVAPALLTSSTSSSSKSAAATAATPAVADADVDAAQAVLIAVLKLLIACAGRSLTLASRIARGCSILSPRATASTASTASGTASGPPRVKVPLLQWLAHVTLLTHTAQLISAQSTDLLPSRVEAAALFLRLLRVVCAQGRGLAADLADETPAGGLGGPGTAAAGMSALRLDVLMQFTPIAGATKRYLQADGAATAAPPAADGGGRATEAAVAAFERPPAVAVHRAALAANALALVRQCASYGCGVDRITATWTALSYLLVPPPASASAAAPAPAPAPAAALRLRLGTSLLHTLQSLIALAVQQAPAALTPLSSTTQRVATVKDSTYVSLGDTDSEEDEEEAAAAEEAAGDAVVLRQHCASLLTAAHTSNAEYLAAPAILASLTALSGTDTASASATAAALHLHRAAAVLLAHATYLQPQQGEKPATSRTAATGAAETAGGGGVRVPSLDALALDPAAVTDYAHWLLRELLLPILPTVTSSSGTSCISKRSCASRSSVAVAVLLSAAAQLLRVCLRRYPSARYPLTLTVAIGSGPGQLLNAFYECVQAAEVHAAATATTLPLPCDVAGPYARRPLSHAAAALCGVLCALQPPDEGPTQAFLAARLIVVLLPGDEGIAADICSNALLCPAAVSAACGGTRRVEALSRRAILLPPALDMLLGAGYTTTRTRVLRCAIPPLATANPGLLSEPALLQDVVKHTIGSDGSGGDGGGGGGPVPGRLTTTVQLLGPTVVQTTAIRYGPSSPWFGGAGGAKGKPSPSPLIPRLLSLLPLPLRTCLGLPLHLPSALSLYTPLLALVLLGAGAVSDVLSPRARATLEGWLAGAASHGVPTGSPVFWEQMLQALLPLLPLLLHTHGSNPRRSAELGAMQSLCEARLFFLLLHCGLLPTGTGTSAGTGGGGLSRSAAAAAVHLLAQLQVQQHYSSSGIHAAWTPLAILAAHADVGSGALCALCTAVLSRLGSEGVAAGHGALAAAALLFLLPPPPPTPATASTAATPRTLADDDDDVTAPLRASAWRDVSDASVGDALCWPADLRPVPPTPASAAVVASTRTAAAITDAGAAAAAAAVDAVAAAGATAVERHTDVLAAIETFLFSSAVQRAAASGELSAATAAPVAARVVAARVAAAAAAGVQLQVPPQPQPPIADDAAADSPAPPPQFSALSLALRSMSAYLWDGIAVADAAPPAPPAPPARLSFQRTATLKRLLAHADPAVIAALVAS